MQVGRARCRLGLWSRPGQAREALKRVAAGEPLREIALSYNVDHSTIHRPKARYVAEV
jgi:hypothetical protein